ncbi:MAG: phage tail protein [Methylobacter sp.]
MNVNGSRFHLLLGQSDWGRCFVRVSDDNLGDRYRRLNNQMPDNHLQSPPFDEILPLAWDFNLNEVCLQSEPIPLGNTPGEAPLNLNDRRSAAADKYGNIYWIDADNKRLRVWSVGSGRESAFWPDGSDNCNALDESDFQPVEKTIGIIREFAALTVTNGHYLIAAFVSSASQGLLVFDLMAGGPAVEMLWPTSIPFAPFDMCQRYCDGVWILDSKNAHVWQLDRHLNAVQVPKETEIADQSEQALFLPLNKGSSTSENESIQKLSNRFPPGIDLTEVIGEKIEPIAVESMQDDIVFILDRNQAVGRSRIFCLKAQGDKPKEILRLTLDELAQDFVVAKTYTRTTPLTYWQLLVATASGNQALAFDIVTDDNIFELRPSSALFPLRLFGGRAVIKVRDKAWYDSGLGAFRWIPVVQQPRARYKDFAELITPIFDGQEIQCIWDRILLDACIPADSAIEIYCRAGDETVLCENISNTENDESCEILSPWKFQPKPYLRNQGSEFPWLRGDAMRPTQREGGIGTWELLLQNIHGRYLQIKLILRGNGMVTPRIRALRAWYPRFSYSKRFLPAVYREDPVAGDFLERFLANMEGMNTFIEGRIAQIQALFDPRTAPSETLEWLASWFDVALDPKWDENRRRLFVKHIMDFFRWRGTVHGLRLALSLAFENCLTDITFADPNPDTLHLQSIRIVEAYFTRKVGAVVAGDAGVTEINLLPPVNFSQLWAPQEDNQGLWERYAKFLGKTLTSNEQLKPFDFIPPEDVDLNRWRQFCEQHLGFVPSIGTEDSKNWDRFQTLHLSQNQDQEIPDIDIDSINYPIDWPTDPFVQKKWRAYLALTNPTLNRWQDFLARRYRRIGKLNKAHQTNWPAFDFVALPVHLPATKAAQTDWLQFERNILAIVRTAHRFSVLLPVSVVTEDPAEMERKVQLAHRIIELEKPAHTVFDVRFYWALNRIGEARLGMDTLLDVGSRDPKLIPDAVLGRAYLGASFVGGAKPLNDSDRYLLRC